MLSRIRIKSKELLCEDAKEVAEFGVRFGRIRDSLGGGGAEELAETESETVNGDFDRVFLEAEGSGDFGVRGFRVGAEEDGLERLETVSLAGGGEFSFKSAQSFTDEGFGPGALVMGGGRFVGAWFKCVAFFGVESVE